MKRWQKALLSAIWAAVVIGIGFLCTDVFLAGKIIPQQDDQISQSFGTVFGIGVLVVWAIIFSRKRPVNDSLPPAPRA